VQCLPGRPKKKQSDRRSEERRLHNPGEAVQSEQLERKKKKGFERKTTKKKGEKLRKGDLK